MTVAIDYEPVKYTYDWGEFKCEHASTHRDVHEFIDASSLSRGGEPFAYDWVQRCDECGAWFNELTNEWMEA